jgi:hypothetical protein
MIHFYDCEFSDLGVQFASPHSFRSVLNSQTTRKHLFASHAKGVAANSQTQTDARDTEFARELVCGQLRGLDTRPQTNPQSLRDDPMSGRTLE